MSRPLAYSIRCLRLLIGRRCYSITVASRSVCAACFLLRSINTPETYRYRNRYHKQHYLTDLRRSSDEIGMHCSSESNPLVFNYHQLSAKHSSPVTNSSLSISLAFSYVHCAFPARCAGATPCHAQIQLCAKFLLEYYVVNTILSLCVGIFGSHQEQSLCITREREMLPTSSQKGLSRVGHERPLNTNSCADQPTNKAKLSLHTIVMDLTYRQDIVASTSKRN